MVKNCKLDVNSGKSHMKGQDKDRNQFDTDRAAPVWHEETRQDRDDDVIHAPFDNNRSKFPEKKLENKGGMNTKLDSHSVLNSRNFLVLGLVTLGAGCIVAIVNKSSIHIELFPNIKFEITAPPKN